MRDEQRGRLIRADKIAQRAKDGAVTELFSLTQQSGSRRRKTNTFAFQRIECVDLSLQRCMSFVRAKQLGAGRGLSVASIPVGRDRCKSFPLGERANLLKWMAPHQECRHA